MRIDNKGYVHKEGLVYKNQFHVIFCPKYRRPVLTNGIDVRLKEILTEEAENMNVTIKEMEVMPDHVHLFLEFDPRMMLHKVIKQLKGTSSRILRHEYPELVRKLPSMWTRSYFSCSVGHVSEETIAQYIEYQKGR